jgi:hypothetical protein
MFTNPQAAQDYVNTLTLSGDGLLPTETPDAAALSALMFGVNVGGKPWDQNRHNAWKLKKQASEAKPVKAVAAKGRKGLPEGIRWIKLTREKCADTTKPLYDAFIVASEAQYKAREALAAAIASNKGMASGESVYIGQNQFDPRVKTIGMVPSGKLDDDGKPILVLAKKVKGVGGDSDYDVSEL